MKAQLKQVTTSPDNSFKVKLFNEKEFVPFWHFHPQYELTYVLQSTGIRYVGDSMQPFQANDLVLVGRNVPHSWKTIDNTGENVKCIVIQWDDNLLAPMLGKPEFRNIEKLLFKSSYGISFSKEIALRLKQQFSVIYEQPPFERLMTLLDILNTLANSPKKELLAGPSFGKSLSTKESHRVNIINNYIKDHFQDQPSIDELAEMLAISKEAFCRFFKKTFDKTFSNYLNEYRITIASKMLIETDDSVSEIGYSSGFNSLSFFHRQFMKHKHQTPKSYRTRYQEINVE